MVPENADGLRLEATATESHSAPSSPVEQRRPFPLAPARSSVLPLSQRPKSVLLNNSTNYTDVMLSTDQTARPVVHSSEASVGYSSVQPDLSGRGHTSDLGKRPTLATVSEDWQTSESTYDVPPPPVPARTYNTKGEMAAAAAVAPTVLVTTNMADIQQSNAFGGDNTFGNSFGLNLSQTDATLSGFDQIDHFSSREDLNIFDGKVFDGTGVGSNPFGVTGDPFNAHDPFELIGKLNDPFDPFNIGVTGWDNPAALYDRPPQYNQLETVNDDFKHDDVHHNISSPVLSLDLMHNGLALSPPSTKPIEDNDCTGESYEDVADFIRVAQQRDASLLTEASFNPVASVFQIPTHDGNASPQETYDFPAALDRHPSREMLNDASQLEEESANPVISCEKGPHESLKEDVVESNGFHSQTLQQSELSQLPQPPTRQPDHPAYQLDQVPIPPLRYPDHLPPLPSKGPCDQNPPLPAPRSTTCASTQRLEPTLKPKTNGQTSPNPIEQGFEKGATPCLSPSRPKSREDTIVELCALGYSRSDVVRAMSISSNDYHLAKKILQEFGHR